MSKESIESKANLYLTTGKIKIISLYENSAKLRAEGSSYYDVTFTGALGWECNCPAHIECAHIAAAKRITNLHRDEHPTLGTNDSALGRLFDVIPDFDQPIIDEPDWLYEDTR